MLKADELRELDNDWIKDIGHDIVEAHTRREDFITKANLSKSEKVFLTSFGYAVSSKGMQHDSYFEISWRVTHE